MDYFVNNKFFSEKQFGFIPGRSTVLQLINVLDIWTRSLESGGQIDVIYTDFEKAFDKVPHRRLLSKLLSYGVHPEVVKWIEMFLCFRTQVRINGKYSVSKEICSGIPQGTVLGPLLFVIFINDLPEHCGGDSELFLFADDAKLFKYINSAADSAILSECCQSLYNWAEKLLMKLNTDKCKVLSIHRSKSFVDNKYYFNTLPGVSVELHRVNDMKDLGVVIDCNLNFHAHIYEKINKAYQMLGIIKRNFICLDKISFILIYKSIVRSHLEYGNAVWNPYKVSLINDLERVQKRATKLVKGFGKMTYRERLEHLKIPTLKFRRVRGDMIEVYKILSGKYDVAVVPCLPQSDYVKTRGNSMKLKTERSRYDLRKYSFTSRIVNLWNSLPDDIVASLSINSFKNKLDKYWRNKDMYYNHAVELTGN
jgi:hypothetical protein